eukprot:6175209-Pleurochrysis_carterae.AAC.1
MHSQWYPARRRAATASRRRWQGARPLRVDSKATPSAARRRRIGSAIVSEAGTVFVGVECQQRPVSAAGCAARGRACRRNRRQTR